MPTKDGLRFTSGWVYIMGDNGTYHEVGKVGDGIPEYTADEPYVVEASPFVASETTTRKQKPKEFVDVDYSEVDNGLETSV